MSIKEVVKEKYGQAALRVVSGSGAACSVVLLFHGPNHLESV
jgi:hypothetical protein